MENFKKENHVEISSGGTEIISSEQCPLSLEEAKELEVLLDVKNQLVPCCICNVTRLEGESKEFYCDNFLKVIVGEKGFVISCAKLEIDE